MRDVVAGNDAVHKAGEMYLPRLTDQSKGEYETYKTRAVFFNATARVVDAMEGLVFRKQPTLEVTSIQDIADNITLTGKDLVSFAQDVVKEQLELTRCGVLVDYPTVDTTNMTAQQAKAAGNRPYAALYTAENIINWRVISVGGNSMLGRVVLREFEEQVDPADEFCIQVIEVYRVLDFDENGAYRQRVWKSGPSPSGKGSVMTLVSTITPRMNGQPMSTIPFVFFGARGNGPEVDEPILNDLAVVNLGHYRNTADYEHGLHFTGLPTPVISGVNDTDAEFRIGSGTAWVLGDPNAKAAYLEFTGQGLTAMQQALKDKEEQMAALGARMLAPDKKDAEAADTIANKRQGEISVLAALANAASRGLTDVLKIIAQWEGVSDNVSIKLNTDYNVVRMGADDIMALLQAVMSNNLSSESFYEAMVRGEVVTGDRTYDEEQALAKKNPKPPEPVATPSGEIQKSRAA